MSAKATSLLYLFITLGLYTTDVTASKLQLYHGSLSSVTSASITCPSEILSCIDKTKKIRIFTHGFNSTKDAPEIKSVISAYLKLDSSNVILLDWIKESQVSTNLEYPVVVIKSMEIASDFAKALIYFIENGVSVSHIYLAGHSVGAHMMGKAAQEVKKKGYTLPWISGLDPAGPFFRFPTGFKGLDASQADYVQVLHTNPGSAGLAECDGDANFWPNCGNDGVQPGCDTGASGSLNKDDFCSHNFAWKIYSEALLCPDCFPAALAESCDDWKCQSSASEINYYGDNADKRKLGNFYFSTNAVSPYSKGQCGATAN